MFRICRRGCISSLISNGHRIPKLDVVGSSPISRSRINKCCWPLAVIGATADQAVTEPASKAEENESLAGVSMNAAVGCEAALVLCAEARAIARSGHTLDFPAFT